MADNVPVTAGVGTDIATDLISSVHYPRHKLIHGADGANDGDVSRANGLPVGPARVLAQEDLVEIGHASFTASWVSAALVNVATSTIVFINNRTNGDLYFRWTSSGNPVFMVPAYSSRALPILEGASQLYHKYLTDPDSGTCYFEVQKG